MKNKIKKTIIILIIIILSFQIFQKFEFLFFQIKVCNNTDIEMSITLDWNKRKFFDKYSLLWEVSFDRFLEKMFKNYERPFRWNSIWFHLSPNTCSDSKNTDLFSSNFSMKSVIYKNKIRYMNCKGMWTDLPESVYNLNYWKNIINLNSYRIKEFSKNEFNYKFCDLYYSIFKLIILNLSDYEYVEKSFNQHWIKFKIEVDKDSICWMFNNVYYFR